MERSRTASVPPARRPRLVAGYAAVLTTVAAALILAGPVGGPSPRAVAAEDGGAVRDRAAALYLANCASCHGPQGQGGGELGPSLIGVGAASADFYLRTGRMPLGNPDTPARRHEPFFEEEEIQLLVAYVAAFGDGPDIPQVRAGGDVGRGWELYQANCAACHAATGAGNAVGGGYAAVGLGQATPVQVAEAMLIGPGVMPRFAYTQEQQDAIVAYVEFLQRSESPGGLPIGGVGPVGEGFVAVVVGLTLFLLIAVFVGRRTHEGEPDLGGPDVDEPAAKEPA